MVAIRFVGWTQTELETLLDRVQTDLLAGRTVSSYSIGSKSVGKTREVRLDLLLPAIEDALARIDPDTYAPRIKRTVARFR